MIINFQIWCENYHYLFMKKIGWHHIESSSATSGHRHSHNVHQTCLRAEKIHFYVKPKLLL